MEAHHPYQKIPEACRTTGLSQYYLRKGCRDGSVPHIRSGKTFYVNVPALLDKLDMQRQDNGRKVMFQNRVTEEIKTLDKI